MFVGVDLSPPCSSFLDIVGFIHSVFGLLDVIGCDVSLCLEKLNSEAISVAFFKKEVFWILFLFFGCRVIFLHGLSGSILLNLSSVSAAFRSLRRLRGSMFASTSQALEGVDFSAAHKS